MLPIVLTPGMLLNVGHIADVQLPVRSTRRAGLAVNIYLLCIGVFLVAVAGFGPATYGL